MKLCGLIDQDWGYVMLPALLAVGFLVANCLHNPSDYGRGTKGESDAW